MFNGLVAPVPIIQILNLLSGIAILLLEWPLPFIKGNTLQRAYPLRFAVYPIVAVLALIQYQCTNASFYLLIGTAYGYLARVTLMSRVYFQAWAEGELIGETGKSSGTGVMRV